MAYLTLVLCLVLANVGYVLGTVLCARMLRLPMEQVALFNGPRLYLRSWLGCIWEVRLLPLGSYVRYNEDAFYAMSKALRILTLMAGPMLTGLFGAWLSPIAYGELLSAFWMGTQHPLTVGANGLRAFWMLCGQDMTAAIGCFLAMHTIINLLPCPITNGGQIVLTLVMDRHQSKNRDVVMWIGVAMVVVMLVAWSVALFGAIWR